MLVKEAPGCGVETPSVGGSDTAMVALIRELGKGQIRICEQGSPVSHEEKKGNRRGSPIIIVGEAAINAPQTTIEGC